MKKIFIKIIIFCFFSGIYTVHSQWIAQYNPSTWNLHDISFINLNTGWACGDGGTIIKTTNSGINWIQQSSGVFEILEGIHGVDSQYVYCVGYFNTILKTTDGGNNWIVIRNSSTQTPSFFKTFFLNRNVGWMLKNNYILRTTNGGISFDSAHVIYSYLWDIYFKDINNGILSGDAALIMKTTNGGIDWYLIQVPIPWYAPNFYRLSLINDYGWVAGGSVNDNLGGLCWKTTNFGLNWDTISRIPYPANIDNYSISFSSMNIGWSGGSYGYVFKTTNGGINWYQQLVPGQNFRADFYFYNDNTGWVAGGAGQILKTNTSGQWVEVKKISNSLPIKFRLYQNYPNPFNSSTIIRFDVKSENVRDKLKVKIGVYDVLGNTISEIINNLFLTGRYEVKFDAANLTTGIYFYRIESAGYSETKKLIFIK